jgi:coenzyme F420-0:L-glutamate ligase/coenzyme F420-1:gamma-L-glutamate ligase
VQTLFIYGLDKIGLVKPGDDIAQLIFRAMRVEHLVFKDGDVIVLSQKVVSKAGGLLIDTLSTNPTPKAKAIARKTGKIPGLVQLILQDSSEVLRADSQALVVRRKDGLICLNAGVDKSNVKGRWIYSRLPPNSDKAANEIRKELEKRSRRKLAVIIADTFSRPMRVGQEEFAIGVAGMEPIVDYRGLRDLFGYHLRFKYVALADEVAAAAELVMGQGTEGTPVAIIRGLKRAKKSNRQNLSKTLLLHHKQDLFHGL